MLFPNGLLLTALSYEAWFAVSRTTQTLRSANGAASRLNQHFNRVRVPREAPEPRNARQRLTNILLL